MCARQSPAFTGVADYRQDLIHSLGVLDYQALESIAATLYRVRNRDGIVYTCGNGGSAANAAHMTLHLSDCSFRTRDLISSAPLLTARSNDLGYNSGFVAQMRTVSRPEDCLVVFSCSGKSLNVWEAVTYSNLTGLTVIAFLGMDGGFISERLPDIESVVVDSDSYGVIEDVHSSVIHILSGLLTD